MQRDAEQPALIEEVHRQVQDRLAASAVGSVRPLAATSTPSEASVITGVPPGSAEGGAVDGGAAPVAVGPAVAVGEEGGDVTPGVVDVPLPHAPRRRATTTTAATNL